MKQISFAFSYSQEEAHSFSAVRLFLNLNPPIQSVNHRLTSFFDAGALWELRATHFLVFSSFINLTDLDQQHDTLQYYLVSIFFEAY